LPIVRSADANLSRSGANVAAAVVVAPTRRPNIRSPTTVTVVTRGVAASAAVVSG